MNFAKPQPALDAKRIRLGILGLAFCNGIGMSSAVIAVAVSAFAAEAMGLHGGWVTVPYGLQFMAVLLSSVPLSMLAERFGRRISFLITSLIGSAGGGLCAIGVHEASPVLFCLGHFCIGISLANVAFFRFAAVDMAPVENRAKALSWVLFGGVGAAILGPEITRDAPFVLPGGYFMASYLGIVILGLLTAVIVAVLPALPPPRVINKQKTSGVSLSSLGPAVTIGIILASVGYGFMNLLMVANPLQLQVCGIEFTTLSYLIQFHVLLMFGPSLIMGHIVSRIGLMGLGFIGAALLWSSTAIALMMPDPVGLGISLLLLGLAWNALYSAGSLLIDRYSPPEHRYRIQGINDTAVGFLAMLGAFLPGGALAGLGWAGMNAAGLVAALGLMVMLAVCWRSSTVTSGLGLETAK
jgi:MFS family permease